jgi:hypothetical protein
MLTRYAGAAVLTTMIAATMATGITYATTTSHSAKACVTHAGALSLLHDGKCAAGSHHITLGAVAPGPAVATYWAQVNAGGHVTHGSGGVKSVRKGAGPSGFYYEVSFPRSVSHCAALATLGENPNNSLSPGAVDASTHGREVQVLDISSNSAEGTVSTGFSLAVFC